MKKIIILLIGVSVLISVFAAGCVDQPLVTPAPANTNDIHGKIYIDSETGVNYLAYRYANGVGICPRYNADGTLMVTPV